MHHDIPELDRGGLRRFGITTGGIFAALFGLLFPYLFNFSWPIWPWVIFAVLSVWGLLAPATLRPVYMGWMRGALLLSRITTPIILTAVFLVAILPAAIILRLIGKDPMRRKFDQTSSYRVDSKQPSANNMEKPY